jgi:hypothetical protein
LSTETGKIQQCGGPVEDAPDLPTLVARPSGPRSLYDLGVAEIVADFMLTIFLLPPVRRVGSGWCNQDMGDIGGG